ncbi:Retrovirus-related Pol polyprotein from transposon gypsy, partial [Mucuna pruriens]
NTILTCLLEKHYLTWSYTGEILKKEKIYKSKWKKVVGKRMGKREHEPVCHAYDPCAQERWHLENVPSNKVMPFGLTNAHSTFMRLINHVLRSLIGKCVVVCFDDLFIYSIYLNDHLLHETLFANLEKCIFFINEIIFLGFVVGSHRVKFDREKEWPKPKIVGEVRSFHGLASFYQIFVKNFSSLVSPLNDVVKESVGKRLCVPMSPIRKLLVKKAHEGGLTGDIPITPWVNISRDCMLGLPRSKRGKDSIFLVVGKF